MLRASISGQRRNYRHLLLGLRSVSLQTAAENDTRDPPRVGQTATPPLMTHVGFAFELPLFERANPAAFADFTISLWLYGRDRHIAGSHDQADGAQPPSRRLHFCTNCRSCGIKVDKSA